MTKETAFTPLEKQQTVAEAISAAILDLLRQKQLSAGDKLPPERELAEMLGLTEETICRVIAELRRTGIIEAPRGKIIVLDRERLQNIADENPVSRSKPPKYSAAQ